MPTFRCESCAHVEKLPEYMAGQATKCRKCGEVGRVAGESALSTEAVEAVQPTIAPVEYRCPFCGSTKPTKTKRFVPQGPLVASILVAIVLPLLLCCAAEVYRVPAGLALIVALVAFVGGLALHYANMKYAAFCSQCKRQLAAH